MSEYYNQEYLLETIIQGQGGIPPRNESKNKVVTVYATFPRVLDYLIFISNYNYQYRLSISIVHSLSLATGNINISNWGLTFLSFLSKANHFQAQIYFKLYFVFLEEQPQSTCECFFARSVLGMRQSIKTNLSMWFSRHLYMWLVGFIR